MSKITDATTTPLPNASTIYSVGAAGVPDFAGISALSPDAMIAYVSEMLGTTDGQIGQMMTAMKEHKAEASFLQKIASEMREAKHGTMVGEKSKLEAIRDEVQAKLDSENPPNPDTKAALDMLNGAIGSLDGNIKGNNGNDKDMTAGDDDWLEAKAATIDNQVSKLTSGTELDMIQLQSLVEQRSHIIAFASKVVASLEDNVKNTIGNMR